MKFRGMNKYFSGKGSLSSWVHSCKIHKDEGACASVLLGMDNLFWKAENQGYIRIEIAYSPLLRIIYNHEV